MQNTPKRNFSSICFHKLSLNTALKKNCLEIYYSKCDKAGVEDSADSNLVVFQRKFQSVISTFRLENESQNMLVLEANEIQQHT